MIMQEQVTKENTHSLKLFLQPAKRSLMSYSFVTHFEP